VPILECRAVGKAYGGLLAVNDLSFAIEPNEVFAIVGPNGAGKTTLFDAISGIAPASSGAVLFDGRAIERLRPHEICRLGLVRTFQTTVVFDSQNVLTNVLIGSRFGRSRGVLPGFSFTGADADAALAAMELCGLDDQSAAAASMPVLARKRLMLATALATQPRLLLLDEPVGGLNAAERETMIGLIRRVAESGVTVLMIEHVMKAVLALAGRMLVLHHGQKIAEGTPAAVLRDERVIDVYLGTRGRRGAGPVPNTAHASSLDA